MSKPGYVYCMSNDAYQGVYKLGRTADPFRRVNELQSTGVPTPFRLEFYMKVKDCARVEKLVHECFSVKRVTTNREFFKCELEDIRDFFEVMTRIVSGEMYFRKYVDDDGGDADGGVGNKVKNVGDLGKVTNDVNDFTCMGGEDSSGEDSSGEDNNVVENVVENGKYYGKEEAENGKEENKVENGKYYGKEEADYGFDVDSDDNEEEEEEEDDDSDDDNDDSDYVYSGEDSEEEESDDSDSDGEELIRELLGAGAGKDGKGNNTYTCDKCGKDFTKISAYKYHQNRKNPCVKLIPEVVPKNTCKWCGLALSNSSSFSRHKRVCAVKKNKEKLDNLRKEKEANEKANKMIEKYTRLKEENRQYAVIQQKLLEKLGNNTGKKSGRLF